MEMEEVDDPPLAWGSNLSESELQAAFDAISMGVIPYALVKPLLVGRELTGFEVAPSGSIGRTWGWLVRWGGWSEVT